MSQSSSETVPFTGTREEAIELLELPETGLDTIYILFKTFPKDMDIESNVAMALSLRTSVYDREKGKHEKMGEMLEALAESADMQARWAVAKNPHTPEAILVKMAKDPVNLVRALVANNPNTPPAILSDLFHDEKIVRDGLTGNPNTPEKLLKLFINENDRMARLRVADNSGATRAVLEALAGDADKDVRICAEKRLESLKA
jgi:hypothetical protein